MPNKGKEQKGDRRVRRPSSPRCCPEPEPASPPTTSCVLLAGLAQDLVEFRAATDDFVDDAINTIGLVRTDLGCPPLSLANVR